MTFRTERRITIAGSVHEVWAYLCDVGRWPEWAPTVLEGRVRGGGPLQPGSRGEQRAELVVGEEPRPEQGGDGGRAAPLPGVRRAHGHVRGALGNGTRAGRRWADRHHDVDRGRPRRHHARPPRPHAQGQNSARKRYRDGGDQGCGRVRRAGKRGVLDGTARLYRDAAELEEHPVTQVDRTREHLIETYRKKAKHYDITSRLYPVPGSPKRTH